VLIRSSLFRVVARKGPIEDADDDEYEDDYQEVIPIVLAV
jgi:hypothetical protein